MDHADWTIQGHHGALRKGRIASQAGLTRRAHCELRTEIASHWGCGILSALFGFPHATPLFSNDIGLCSPEECIIDARTLPLHRRFFTGLLSPLQIALEEQVVHFREGNQFRLYYASTLKNYASETFLCSTTMKTFSIWLDTSISAANARFIKAGGKIRQIVFIKSGDDVSSVEFQKFVLHQKSIGVEIFIASMSMDTHVLMIELLRKDLFVGTRAPVAWEVFVDDSENIGLSVLIVNPSKIEDYRRVLDLAHQYTPEDAGPAIS